MVGSSCSGCGAWRFEIDGKVDGGSSISIAKCGAISLRYQLSGFSETARRVLGTASHSQ